MSEDFGEFTVTATRKPVAGVVSVDIPEPLVKLLAEHAPKALNDPDYEIVITAKDKATAQKLALYSRAWGARQTPKLRITKVPNGKRYDDNVARLSVAKDDEVPAENRPGRRPNR